MADVKVKYDYKPPENISCEVPGEQNLREGTDDELSTLPEGDTAQNEKFVFSPVMTVTTNEATLAKGDMKLQRVSVTEDISKLTNGVNALDPERPIISEVPSEQPIRMEPQERKTRIPTRFKQAVNRVRRDKSLPNRSEGEMTLSTHPRRSSIPRLKTKPRPSSPKPEEDEFDKIYDEIVDSPVDIDVSLLNAKVDDQVEDIFEEIVHEYDEGKMKPITLDEVKKEVREPVERKPNATERSIGIENGSEANLKPTNGEKPKSRIPMLKRTSEPDLEVIKSFQNLVKNKPTSDRDKVQNAVSRFRRDGEAKVIKPPRRSLARNNDNNNNVKQFKDGEKHEIQIEKIEMHGSYETDIAPENIIKVNDFTRTPNNSLEDQTLATVEISNATNLSNDYQELNKEPSVAEVIEETSVLENNDEVSLEEVKEQTPTVLETDIQQNPVEMKLTPIKVISEEEFAKIVENTPILNKRDFTPIKTFDKADFYVNQPSDLLRGGEEVPGQMRNIGKSPSSGYIDEISNYVTSTPPENEKLTVDTANNEETNVKDSEDDIPILKGKVSRIINRIRSLEEEEPKKDKVEDRPKPKSLLSKIAMFERQEPVVKPKARDTRPPPKPQIFVENTTDFKPKIIDEVLKPMPRGVPVDSEDYNPTAKFEVNVTGTAVTTDINAEEIVTEELPSNEFDPYESSSKNEISIEPIKIEYIEVAETKEPESNDRNEEVILRNVERDISLTPNQIEFVDNPTNTDEIKSKINESWTKEPISQNVKNEINFKSIEIEYEKVENEFTPKVHESKNEDVVYINHINETAQFDAARRKEIVEAINTEQRKDKTNDFGKIKFESLRNRREESPFNFMPTNVQNHRTPNNSPMISQESPFDFKPKYNRHTAQKDDDDYKILDTSLDHSVNRPSRYRSTDEDSNLRKAKSVADLDKGPVAKGRIHDIIVRMKSVDRSVEKREVINVKERPRKKSVSEKIALFEGKLSVPSTQPAPRAHKQPPPASEGMSPAELETRTAELAAAKATWGENVDTRRLLLGDGAKMPVLAIGTALLDKQLTPHVVAAAIDLGYRAIDTAWVYGNEKEVGEGIKAKIEDGTVKREDLFIVNKLWSTFHRQDLVEEACRRSLDAMGLEYFDLYLVHNPMSFKEGLNPIPKIASVIQYSKHDYLDAWYGMEELVTKGLVRSVGLSNFNSVQVQRVLDRARVKPVINMVECHPYLTQERLDDFCAERNIKLLTYGVLGSKGTPAELKGSSASAIDDPLIQVMAAGLGVTPAQLLIRFQLDSGHAVVAKASSAAHLWDNLQALNFSLTEGQVDAIKALNKNKRAFTFKGMGDTHKNYPFNIAF